MTAGTYGDQHGDVQNLTRAGEGQRWLSTTTHKTGGTVLLPVVEQQGSWDNGRWEGWDDKTVVGGMVGSEMEGRMTGGVGGGSRGGWMGEGMMGQDWGLRVIYQGMMIGNDNTLRMAT